MRQGFVPSLDEQAHGQSVARPAGIGMHVLDTACERRPNVLSARCRGNPEQPPVIHPWHAYPVPRLNLARLSMNEPTMPVPLHHSPPRTGIVSPSPISAYISIPEYSW